MPINILMPALSPTMTEGNLVKWLKNEGDKVKAGEILAEIETDKATMEVEAVDEGVIGKIIIQAGTENVKVNELIAVLLEDGEDASNIVLDRHAPAVLAMKPEPAEKARHCEERSDVAIQTQSINSGDRLFASPLAKRIAADKGINLNTVQGSGPHGRIVKADVENAKAGSIQTHSTVHFANSAYEDIKLNGMRKTIAKRLTEAKQTIPHFYLSIDCCLDELLNLRTKLNERPNAKVKLSVNDFVVRAVALALIDAPKANVTFHGDYLRQYTQSDVCVAVAIDGGLVTPIVKAANLKSLTDISLEVKDLAERARAGKLPPEAYQGGSFTISNLGMYGIKNFDAIINPPQACILAVGAGEKRAVVNGNEIKIANMMTCTLSIDHRALDGAVGSEFLKAFKSYIENPFALMS